MNSVYYNYSKDKRYIQEDLDMRTYKLYNIIYLNAEGIDFAVCLDDGNIRDVVPESKDRPLYTLLGEFNSKESLVTLLTAFHEKYRLKCVNDGVLLSTCSIPSEHFLDIQDKLDRKYIQNSTNFIMEMIKGNKVMQPVPVFN